MSGVTYFAGQRVLIYGKEIGTVCPQRNHEWRPGYIWVKDCDGIPHHYADHNIKPLPGGQL